MVAVELFDFATKPAWICGVLRGKRRTFGNLMGHLRVPTTSPRCELDRSQFDTSLNWKDVEWIRSIWPGKLVLKGILDVEDADEAVKTGAQALVVSNHGGRQLDGAHSSIECCRRSSTPSARKWKSCSTAASAPARM